MSTDLSVASDERGETSIRHPEPSDEYWYKTIVLGVGLAATAALLFSLRPLLLPPSAARDPNPWSLSASHATFFREFAESSFASRRGISSSQISLVIAFMQSVTMAIFTLSGTFFVWNHVRAFASHPTRRKALLEVAIFICVVVCCATSSSTVWAFRSVGFVAAGLWFWRASLRTPLHTPYDRAFVETRQAYQVLLLVGAPALIFGVLATAAVKDWHSAWLVVDLSLTLVPFLVAVGWTFAARMLFNYQPKAPRCLIRVVRWIRDTWDGSGVN